MYLLFDIGGTSMRIAASPDGKSLSEPIIIPTPQDFEEGIKEIEETAQTLAAGEKIKAVAGGIREVLDKKRCMLINDPISSKIPGWIGKPLKEKLEEALKAPVCLENDSALVGLGEAIHGSGKGHKIVAYITVSTGVGGARIVDGKVDRNCFGFEPGNQIIDYREKVYLEDLISGPALEKKFGMEPHLISDPLKWDHVAKILAVGLNNAVVHWSPDILVLGGGVIDSIPLEKVRAYLKAYLRKFPVIPLVSRAKLEDKGGLFGALEYLKQVHALI